MRITSLLYNYAAGVDKELETLCFELLCIEQYKTKLRGSTAFFVRAVGTEGVFTEYTTDKLARMIISTLVTRMMDEFNDWKTRCTNNMYQLDDELEEVHRIYKDKVVLKGKQQPTVEHLCTLEFSEGVFFQNAKKEMCITMLAEYLNSLAAYEEDYLRKSVGMVANSGKFLLLTSDEGEVVDAYPYVGNDNSFILQAYNSDKFRGRVEHYFPVLPTTVDMKNVDEFKDLLFNFTKIEGFTKDPRALVRSSVRYLKLLNFISCVTCRASTDNMSTQCLIMNGTEGSGKSAISDIISALLPDGMHKPYNKVTSFSLADVRQHNTRHINIEESEEGGAKGGSRLYEELKGGGRASTDGESNEIKFGGQQKLRAPIHFYSISSNNLHLGNSGVNMAGQFTMLPMYKTFDIDKNRFKLIYSAVGTTDRPIHNFVKNVRGELYKDILIPFTKDLVMDRENTIDRFKSFNWMDQDHVYTFVTVGYDYLSSFIEFISKVGRFISEGRITEGTPPDLYIRRAFRHAKDYFYDDKHRVLIVKRDSVVKFINDFSSNRSRGTAKSIQGVVSETGLAYDGPLSTGAKSFIRDNALDMSNLFLLDVRKCAVLYLMWNPLSSHSSLFGIPAETITSYVYNDVTAKELHLIKTYKKYLPRLVQSALDKQIDWNQVIEPSRLSNGSSEWFTEAGIDELTKTEVVVPVVEEQSSKQEVPVVTKGLIDLPDFE